MPKLWTAQASATAGIYRRWYAEHTYAETVNGFAAEIAGKVRAALEPAAVAAIVRHAEALDAFVNPVLLSPAARTIAGGFGGSASIVSAMFLGLPDFASGIMRGEIGLTRIVQDSWGILRQANELVLAYARGEAPADPYERAFAASEALGAGLLVLIGAKSGARGGVKLMRGLAGRAARSIPPAPMLITAEGIAIGVAGAAHDGAAVAAAATEVGGGLLFMQAKPPAGGVGAHQAALDRYRAMGDRELMGKAETQRRLAALKGKRRHLIRKIIAEESLEPQPAVRRLSSDMTVAQKRAFVQVLIERRMEREALRLLADWEHVSQLRQAVRAELVQRGTRLGPAPEPPSVASGFFSSLDDAALARVAEKATDLLRRDAARRTFIARTAPNADPYVMTEIANLGESRGLTEMLRLCRTEELAVELARRGFADDAFILEKLFAAADH